MIKILFSAGEASGDQHAAHLFLALKRHYPSIYGFGMGGDQMQQAGIELHYHATQNAVLGVFEVLKHLGQIRQAFRCLQQLIIQQKPDLLICIDYKEFNLKLAQFAKKHQIKVLFYISPQIWAWRPKRVKTYGRAIDMMAVIFPFETAYYAAENVPVRYVGHPCIDSVKVHYNKADYLPQLGLHSNQPIIGLLPGSREQEIKRLLPLMLSSAEQFHQPFPSQWLLFQAESISDSLLATYLTKTSIPIQIIKQQRYEAINCCDMVMSCSGTATLEVALLGIPLLIVYKLSPLTYLLGKYLIHTPFIGLPNIIAGQKIVTEWIQHQANPKNLTQEMQRILTDSLYAQTMREQLQQLKKQLGESGASDQVALLALEMLNLSDSNSNHYLF